MSYEKQKINGGVFWKWKGSEETKDNEDRQQRESRDQMWITGLLMEENRGKRTEQMKKTVIQKYFCETNLKI